MEIKLTPQGEERISRLLAMLDAAPSISYALSERDVIDLAINLLMLAGSGDPQRPTGETLKLASALFRVENERGVF